MNQQKDIVQQWKEAEGNNWLRTWIVIKCILMFIVATALFFAMTSIKVLLAIACIAFIAGGSN